MSTEESCNNYQGTKVLENLEDARNYNNSLKKLVCHYAVPGKTLDFGAGIGTFSKLVKGELAPDCLEIDSRQVAQLKGFGFNVFTNLEELKEGGHHYDFIYSLNVLEHIENDKEAIEELWNILNPGGKILIFVPAFNHLFSQFDRALGHHRRYTKKTLSKLFHFHDSKIQVLRYFDFMGYFAAFVYKILNLKVESASKKNILFFDKFIFPLSKVLDFFFSPFLGKNVLLVIEKT